MPVPQMQQIEISVEGTEHATFQAAAVALGVARDDREWEYCLQEAVGFKSAQQLRHLFAILLLWCTPAKPEDLFLQFKEVSAITPAFKQACTTYGIARRQISSRL